MVAARQVSAADAVPEKYIARYKKALLPAIKPHAAGRVPREEENFQFIFSYRHRPAGNEIYQFAPVILEGHSPLKPHGGSQCQKGLFLFVEMEG